MPLANAHYRFKDMGGGKKIRLAFVGDQVQEAKAYQDGAPTGKVHTPAEFKADKKHNKLMKAMMGNSAHSSTAMR